MGVADILELRGRMFELMMRIENFAAAVERRKQPFPNSGQPRSLPTAQQTLEFLRLLTTRGDEATPIERRRAG